MINLSLCGCGFLGVYHLGVLKGLIQHAPSFVGSFRHVAGASAGALIATILVCGPEKLDVCTDFSFNLANDIRKKRMGPLTPDFSLLDPVREFLGTNLPTDGYQRASGRLYISLTKKDKWNKLTNEVATTYASNEELTECLVASCYIPLYAGVKYPVINGQTYIDGGITDNLYVFKEGRTITVSPFSGDQDISPDDPKELFKPVKVLNQTFKVNQQNAKRQWHALFPPPNDVLVTYYDAGLRDAVRFLKKEGFLEKP